MDLIFRCSCLKAFTPSLPLTLTLGCKEVMRARPLLPQGLPPLRPVGP